MTCECLPPHHEFEALRIAKVCLEIETRAGKSIDSMNSRIAIRRAASRLRKDHHVRPAMPNLAV